MLGRLTKRVFEKLMAQFKCGYIFKFAYDYYGLYENGWSENFDMVYAGCFFRVG